MSVYECRDPSHQAFKLGLAAVVLLVAAHFIANLLGSCILITSEQELDRAPSKHLAAASLVLSWLMLFTAFSLLIAGTLANSKSPKFCRMFTSRPLYIGRIMCFIHGLFVVAYYVTAVAIVREASKLHQPRQEASPA